MQTQIRENMKQVQTGVYSSMQAINYIYISEFSVSEATFVSTGMRTVVLLHISAVSMQ